METTEIKTPMNKRLLSVDNFRQAVIDISSGVLTADGCQVLKSMLQSETMDTLADALKLVEIIAVGSVQTKEQFFDENVHFDLIRILKSHTVLPRSIVKRVLSTVSNLSLSDKGQTAFNDALSALLDMVQAEDDCLARESLCCLSNLCLTSVNHSNVIKSVQIIADQLDSRAARKEVALRLLVNLSVNPDNVIHIMSAKCPVCGLNMLVEQNEKIRIGWLQLLFNVSDTVLQNRISETELPMKTISDQCIYRFLYNRASSARIMEHLLDGGTLIREEDELSLVTKLYKSLSYKQILSLT